MRAIVIFASLMAVALARPDVSHLAQAQGYQYSSPNNGGGSSTGGAAGTGIVADSRGSYSGSSNAYNVQTNQGQSGSGGFGGNGQQQQQSFGGQQQSFGGSGSGGQQAYQSGSGGQQSYQSGGSFGGQSGQSGFGSSGSSGSGSFGGQSGQSGFGSSGSGSVYNGGSSSSGQFGQSSGSGAAQIPFSTTGNVIQGQSQSIDLTGGSSGGGVIYKPVIKQGEPIITKNFYVHAAPEEDENVRVEEKVQVVRPQKSYKIIFIKAPSSGSSYNAANYPVFPQNEEKTIVYVLSKKDQAISEFGEIPTPPPAVTHKPEVYFIKYKTKQEAADAVANIQAQYKAESASSSGANSFGSIDSGSGNFGGSVSGGGNFGSSGSGTSGSVSNFGASGSGSGSYGGSSGSSGSGSSSFGSSVSTADYRGDDLGDDNNVDIASFLPSDNGQSSNFQAVSSQSSFGPSGGQTTIQSFGSNGGGSISHTQHTEGSNGHHSSESNGGSHEIVPQNIVSLGDEAAFAAQQQYLPPNCSNC